MTPEEQRQLATARKVNPQAQDEYLLARFLHYNGNPVQFPMALEHVRNAIRLQPDYAAAYAEFASIEEDMDLPTKRAEMLQYAQRALELDPNLSEAHSTLAGVREMEWDWAAAEAEYRKAVELNPASLDACGCYAGMLGVVLGRFEEAHANIEHALSVNPMSTFVHSMYGAILYFNHRPEEALVHARRGFELEPQNQWALYGLAVTSVTLGKFSDAVAVAERLEPPFSAARAYVYAAAGRRADAEKAIQSAIADPMASPYFTAIAYFRLGEKEKGFQSLTKALDTKDVWVTSAIIDPAFDSVRSDPRFQQLVARLKIPDPPRR